MSATQVKAFIVDIGKKDLKAVQKRLKTEKSNQRYNDPTVSGAHYTLLHKAVQVGSAVIVSALVKAGAAVDAADQGGATPLHWLAAFEDAEHVALAGELIGKHKAAVEARDAKGATPLHAAAAHANTAVAALLLKHGASAGDAVPGYTPMHVACKHAALPVVELLLQAGAAANALDKDGFSPLMRLLQLPASAKAGDTSAVRAAAGTALLSRPASSADWAVGAQEPAGGRSALLLACSWPQPVEALAAALIASGGASIVDAQTRPEGHTPLMLALQAGWQGMATLLLRHTQQIDASTSLGDTALTLAAAAAEPPSSDPSLLEAVLGAGPSVGAMQGRSLLHKALAARWDEVSAQVIHLLPEGALKAEAAQSAGSASPLTFEGLAGQGLGRAACALLARTTPGGVAALAQLDGSGRNALHRAAADNQAALVAGLLRLGIKVDATTSEGDSALHLAAKHGHIQACKELVDGGANALWCNAKNRTPGGQLKLPDATREYLAVVEAQAREERAAKQKDLWDGSMRATQTQSACIVGAV